MKSSRRLGARSSGDARRFGSTLVVKTSVSEAETRLRRAARRSGRWVVSARSKSRSALAHKPPLPPLCKGGTNLRRVLAALGCVVVLSCSLAAALAAEPDGAAAAGKFRAGGEAVNALGDGSLLVEAEEFATVGGGASAGGWKAGNFGENYYAATLANTFLSRKAFLGAPEQCEKATATINVNVESAGKHLCLVRYEACFRFQTQFRVQIEQGGKTVLDRLYGARENPKIWAFGEKLKPEVMWPWGAVENVVWEGHDAAVDLQPGPAKITLIAVKQPEPAARRNVDCLLLTRDIDDVKQRIEKESYLPLDGLLTQEGDVYFRLKNDGPAGLTLTVPNTTEHSPYWVHLRRWKPKTIAAEPGKTTDWVEVGSLMDSLSDGQWNLAAATAKDMPIKGTLEAGVRDAAGTIAPVASFSLSMAKLTLAYDAGTRYTRRIRTQDRILYDLLEHLRKQPFRGKLPERTLIYGYTFDKTDDPQYNTAVDEFKKMFALSPTNSDEPGDAAFPRGYIDVRGQTPVQLEKTCQDLQAKGLAGKIAVVSLGDEIGLASPHASDHEGYREFLKSIGAKPADVDPAAGDDWNKIQYTPGADAKTAPRQFYFAARFRHHYGIGQQKALTDVLRKYLPNAGIGANYSPHHGTPYLGHVHQWVTLFRQGGMTMPWSEDWIFQMAVGSQQMNAISLDLFRAAIKGQPKAKIHFYVMSHWPGNTPESWRRQFFNDLGHGMQIVNLFEFRPVQAAYTENHNSLPAMYDEVRKSFGELSQFEDILQDGRVEPGIAALWFSETDDIWHDSASSFGAGKRTLYVAIRHQQIPLDFVVEEDALAGDLKNYKILYLTDRHVSRAASQKIAEWVRSGGRLFATAGAGMFDEFNEPNKTLRELMGVEFVGLDAPEDRVVLLEKQDLPFSQPIDRATWTTPAGTGTLDIVGVRSRVTAPAAGVTGKFSDGSPAVVAENVGQGSTTYCGFLPALTYFQRAIPRRPLDRNSSPESMMHFIPTQFDTASARLIALPGEGVARPIECSSPLVEACLVRAPQGVVITLVNWSPQPIKGLKVTVRSKAPTASVTLAGGGAVAVAKEDGGQTHVFTLDLDVADALVLR